MKKNKEYRNMTVTEMSGYRYKPTPAIRISGQWLKSVGFDIGDKILVKCENGRLIITPDTAGMCLAEEEKAFMEREMKKIHDRFLQEHQLCVAEPSADYGKEGAYV